MNSIKYPKGHGLWHKVLLFMADYCPCDDNKYDFCEERNVDGIRYSISKSREDSLE